MASQVVDFERLGQVASVQKALNILTAFTPAHPERSLGELASVAGVHKSTALRILATLEAAEFVEHDPTSGKYRLGIRTLEVAGVYLSHTRLEELAYPVLRSLSAELGLTASVGILDGTSIVLVASVEGAQPFAVRSSVGIRNAAHCSSIGKALLASLPPSKLNQLYDGSKPLLKRSPKSIGSVSALQKNLQATRARGYAIDEEETSEGIRCVAATIRDRTKSEIAAISVSGLVSSIPLDAIEAVAARVRVAADEISRRLGGPTG